MSTHANICAGRFVSFYLFLWLLLFYYYYLYYCCCYVLFELVMHIMYYVNSVIISLSFLGPMLMEAVASSPKEGAAFP